MTESLIRPVKFIDMYAADGQEDLVLDYLVDVLSATETPVTEQEGRELTALATAMGLSGNRPLNVRHGQS